MNPIEELARTQAELTQSDEWRRIQEVRHFSETVDLFNRNYAAMMDLIDQFNSRNPDFYLNLRNEPERQNIHTELTRLVHNFLSIAFTLVDHTRILYQKKYANVAVFRDYEDKKSLFTRNQIALFIKDFRNYVLHYSLPEFSHRTEYAAGKGWRFYFALRKATLLASYDWKAAPRQFIEDFKDYIDIRPIMFSYRAQVSEFYKWFFEKLSEFHSDDIAAVNAKQTTYNRALAKAAPGIILGSINAEIKLQGPEDVFLGIVNPLILREYSIKYPDPVERIKMLIEHLQPDFGFESALSEKLIKFAKKYASP